MPLIVFQCESCNFHMKHVMTNAIKGSYSSFCPGCHKNARFNFLREGDPVKDWYSNVIKERKRQRDQLLLGEQGGDQPIPSPDL